ncbi:MAG: hypothetical protein MUF87_22000 [Anaerolineae bacterium]|jgi:hypothetical protein|nr:hypothetical protein [Anaerolineae bacterium]
MDSVIFEIKQYMVVWRQLEQREFNGTPAQIRGMVRCSGVEPRSGEAYSMDVMFLSPESAFPSPFYDVANKKGFMFLPISDIMAVVDLLRHEKPIFGHLRGDRPDWMSITTSQEPVGEGDSDQS